MDVVVHPTGQQWFEVVLPRDTTEVRPDAFLNFRAKPWLPVFSAKDQMILEAGEGIRHNVLGFCFRSD
jgi:hypothetical protein